MIPKKAKAGRNVAGLLYYLYGPGRANEHTNPHMVAAWDANVMDPATTSATIPHLAKLLEAPVYALEGKPPSQHVYHVPVRIDPGDRKLSEAEWDAVAREIMDASGIAPKGDPMGARWVAVRHADDHIHIVATLARQDGRAPNVRGDYRRMQARARELEKRLGLRQLTSGDKTAKKWETTAEREKAKRHGRDETPRATLQERVRTAAAGAQSEAEFFAAIERSGVRLKKRIAPDGAITGYSVALPGDRTGAGRAVWFSGSRLAPDLSLPRVRERWTGGSSTTGPTVKSRAEAWHLAAAHVHQAAAVLGTAGNEAAAGEVMALADFLTTFAAQAPGMVRDELRTAAREFERAGRAPTSRRMDSQASAHLRTATQVLAMGASVVATGGEAAAVIVALVAVALAVAAAARWHQAAQHRAQERAAAQAGTHLRAATEMAYGATGRGRRRSGRPVVPGPDGPALMETYAPVVRNTLPQMADSVINDGAFPALAATLRQTKTMGYEPGEILAEVAAWRDFHDAESAAEVLVWRLQRRMDNDTRKRSSETHKPAPRSDASDARVTTTRRAPDEPSADDVGTENPTAATPPPVVGRSAYDAITLTSGVSLGDAVRQAVPDHAAAVLADPAAPTLAAYLIKAAEDGTPPAELLAEVAGARDLADADSVAQVLAWRLQGRVRGEDQRPASRAGRATPKRPTAPAPTPAQRPTTEPTPPQRNQPKGPRR
uniref:relaxase/mobilization nuclease domain-containing protein n=1 Tax=unclassified Streptomyces TaxID=2593676 RepID=UPI003F493C66